MNKKNRTLFILGFLLLVTSINNAVQAQTDATALEIFRAVNLAYGGEKLDNLKTLRMKSSTSEGEEGITLYDLTTPKIRVEIRKNNKLEIRQLEGNEGWEWVDGKKKQLSEQQKFLFKLGFCLSEIGLRSKCLKTTSFGETIIDEEAKAKYLSVTISGEEFGYVIDEKNRLKEIIKIFGDVTSQVVFDDFQTVNGIVFAFLTTSKVLNRNQPIIGGREVITKFSSIEVNPEFTESDWAVPN